MATNGQSSDSPAAMRAEAASSFKAKRGNRTRPGPKPEEYAGEQLLLGDEFEDAHALSVSEARLIVDATEKQRRKDGKKLRETEHLMKMMTYLDTFARFRTVATMNQLEFICKSYTQLQTFETAQLISLCCATTDEARLLVPSLGPAKPGQGPGGEVRITDEDLETLLGEINSQLQFTEES